MESNWTENVSGEISVPPPVELTAAPPRESAPALVPSAVVPVRATRGVFLWLSSVIVMLLVVSLLAPPLAEQIQYSLSRGKQRAEYELAGEMLSQASLGGISQASQLVAQRIHPSVVIINVNSAVVASNTADELPHDEDLLRRFHGHIPDALGQGSGVVISSDGLIMTNYHVVRDARDIRISLSDGRRLPATRTAVDQLTDLALLKVEADNLTPIEWGDSDELQVGSLIWAVGSPFGLERSVSFGILSAKNRGRIAGSPHQDFLQTDAAVNPGNSGGPLVDAQGRVVGINTAIVGQTYSGVSFAIPSSVARDVAERLKAGGYVPRGWLGVQLASISEEQAKELGLESTRGAFIAKVVDDGRPSPAQQSGIQPGDVVLRWDGVEIPEPATLSQLVARTKVGSTVQVDVVRHGQPTTLNVTVVERPREFN